MAASASAVFRVRLNCFTESAPMETADVPARRKAGVLGLLLPFTAATWIATGRAHHFGHHLEALDRNRVKRNLSSGFPDTVERALNKPRSGPRHGKPTGVYVPISPPLFSVRTAGTTSGGSFLTHRFSGICGMLSGVAGNGYLDFYDHQSGATLCWWRVRQGGDPACSHMLHTGFSNCTRSGAKS